MTEAEVYYDLVNALILYEHATDIKGLLAEFVAILRQAGVSPQDAADCLYDALTEPVQKP